MLKTLLIAGENAVNRGFYSDAVSILKRACAIAQKNAPAGSSEYAFCLEQLANAQILQGNLLDAEHALRCALSIYRSLPTPEYLSIARVLRDLSDVVSTSGNEIEAKRLRLEASAIIVRNLKIARQK